MKSRALARLTFALVLAIACDHVPVAPARSPTEGGNTPPIAKVSGTSFTREGWLANFSADGSSDPDGDSLFYTWDWGDGTQITTTYPRQNHRYADNGRYEVALTVTDGRGATAQATTIVTIGNSAPVITAAQLSTPQLPAQVPLTVTLHLETHDAGIHDDPIATIDWGDGTTSRDTVHAYQTPGVFLPSVTVTDKDSASSTQRVTNAGRFHVAVWAYDGAQQHPGPPGYDVTDLGTLGGTTTHPAAFNSRGEVVGWSTTATDSTHAFLWRDGAMIDLNPAGQSICCATAINDAGWIAGPSAGYAGQLPLWRDGSFLGFMPVPSSEYGAGPVKISESGDVLLNVEGHEFPDATLMRAGTAIRLVEGTHAGAVDMNSHQQVVGWVGLRFIGGSVAERHGFLWDDGVFKDLGSIGTERCSSDPKDECGHSYATDINERGQIVGSSFDGQFMRAVLWDADDLTAQDLGFGGGDSQARAINDNGQIAGDSYGKGDAYFRDGDEVISLGSLGGGATRVMAMNEQGVVVGTSLTAAGEIHAFVWSQATGMRDLGTGPFGAPGIGSIAIGINERGDVLGYVLPCPRASEGSCYRWLTTRGVVWRSQSAALAPTVRD